VLGVEDTPIVDMRAFIAAQIGGDAADFGG